MQFSCELFAVPRTGIRPGPPLTASKKPSTSALRCAPRRDADYGGGGGGFVDEDMIVLRRRIHEMRMAETNWEPPADWAVWEKEWSATYDADVCELVGVLQAFLMSSRPSVGVGLLALLMLCVPTSAFFVVCHLLQASQVLLSNLH